MEQILEDFFQLTQLEVYSRQERRIADAVIEKLEALGLMVYEDDTATKVGGDTGNIKAILKGDPNIQPIMFSAHLDRVNNNGKITPLWDEGKKYISADGKTILAADDVAGICVILECLRRIKAENIEHGDIEVALSVCEEVGVLGSRYFDFAWFKSKLAFVFDISGSLGRIVNSAAGNGRITIEVHGRSAHAGNEPEKGLNAVRVAADLLMNLPDGRLSANTTTNFSILSAGQVTNIVCDYVKIVGEQRSTSQEEYDNNINSMKKIVNEIAQKYKTKIDFSIYDLYPSFNVACDAVPCRIAKKAMSNLGIEASVERGGGGMDGNHFNAYGIETIGIAPGYINNHTSREKLNVAEFLSCADLAVELVKVTAKGDF